MCEPCAPRDAPAPSTLRPGLYPPRYKTAAVAVAHRLCRILFAMLRDGSDFEPQRIGVEEGIFTRTVTY